MGPGLGVWGGLRRCCPVSGLEVWDACSGSRIGYGRPDGPVSWIVENDELQGALKARLDNLPNVTHHHGAAITRLRHAPSSCPSPPPFCTGIEALIDAQDPLWHGRAAGGGARGRGRLPGQASGTDWADGIELSGRCRVVGVQVGADGAQSTVRTSLNHRYISWSYGQKGVVATLHIHHVSSPELVRAKDAKDWVEAGPENSIAWQRFTKTGPIALLPLRAGLSSLVWSTSEEEATRLQALSSPDFVRSLNTALVGLLSSVPSCSIQPVHV